MVIKFGKDSYVDIDLVSSIIGRYDSPDPEKWNTAYICDGIGCEIRGPIGKNILEAFIWKYRTSIYDMMPESENYRKQIK